MNENMYYKEKVVNGVLCYQQTPHGEWKPFDAKALTVRIQRLDWELNYFKAQFQFVVFPE